MADELNAVKFAARWYTHVLVELVFALAAFCLFVFWAFSGPWTLADLFTLSVVLELGAFELTGLILGEVLIWVLVRQLNGPNAANHGLVKIFFTPSS